MSMFPELTEFDKCQIDKLARFVERGAILHFPFFANTFSIAFHYSTAFLQKDNTRYKIRNCILEHDWDEPIPAKLREGKDNIFYTTLDAIEKAKQDRSNEIWSFFECQVSNYNPKYIFAEYHPHLDIQFSTFKNSPQDNQTILPFSKNLIDKAKKAGVNNIEIFTDIPTQANVIAKDLVNWGFPNDNIVILANPVEAIIYYKASTKILRLFYYGAPTTSRMLRDKFRYISFELSLTEKLNDDKTMTTCICLAKPKDTSFSKEIESDLDILSKYHKSIFDTAKEKSRHIDFINILWAYNRFAERKQHSAIFANTKDFAKCLDDHHKTPYELATNE